MSSADPGHSPRRPPEAPQTRRPPRPLALAVATAGGVGFIPVAPGTWGSVVGVAAFIALAGLSPLLFAVTWCGVLALGVWSAAWAERFLGRHDDGRIVIDEVAGQMLALSPLFFFRPGSITPGLVTGFVAFRVFDIWKPGPVRWAERRFRGGVGVMADDVVAGGLAAGVLALLLLATEARAGAAL